MKEYWCNNYRKYKLKSHDRIRSRLEICLNNNEKNHIGWINYYNIDQFFKYTNGDGKCTIGIAIPEQK